MLIVLTAGTEEMVLEEVNLFKVFIHKNIRNPINFLALFNLPIINVLWRMIVGVRFDYDDPNLNCLMDKLTKIFKRLGKPEVLINCSFPWIVKLFPSFCEEDKNRETINDLRKLMREHIKHHQETLDPNDPRDFIDKYLIEIENTTDENSSFYKSNGVENLEGTLLDLFMAGSETTSTTLSWAVLFMIRYPDVQRKVQEEIDTVVGVRNPSMEDWGNLPYTEVINTMCLDKIKLIGVHVPGCFDGGSKIC